MKALCLLAMASALVVGCGTSGPAPASKTATTTLSPQPHSNLAQVMRGIPFPSSNIIFDTQTEDPGAEKPPVESAKGATAAFSSVYGGWQSVENSALALAETANLLMVPGRLCENGRPVPLDREDFRRFVTGLADAGNAAYLAAQSKNLDAMVEVSGTVSDACAQCHEIYRDKDDPKDRCMP
jgi:cytochrome c556